MQPEFNRPEFLEWGAEPGVLYYVLKIEKVEEVRNHVLLG